MELKARTAIKKLFAAYAIKPSPAGYGG